MRCKVHVVALISIVACERWEEENLLADITLFPLHSKKRQVV